MIRLYWCSYSYRICSKLLKFLNLIFENDNTQTKFYLWVVLAYFEKKETTWTHISECESMVCRRLGWIFMDGCFCIVYCMCIFYDWDILLWDVCVEDLGILYVFVYMLYVYIVYNMYTCMILSVRCMLCAEDWDGYIVFSQDRTDNPAFLNIPLIERWQEWNN